ncbi:multidrug ABC transporter permease [Rugosimonospora africana]|uniref:Multidrug ABC transporter permease n=1 Tax=Rugosimonospora africana TaxID=556532 RepID=A0A8J3QYG9_9ACTN|nr:multidrug ABC transporter permease [Rugosimonospora africana]
MAGGIAVVAMALNLLIGVLPFGFVIGTSVAVERVVGAGRGGWGGVLVAVGLAVASMLLQAVLAPFQAAFGELISRRVDGTCARRLMRATLAEAPLELLERPDVLDKMGDARRGLVEYFTTPGAAVAGLIALVARYAQLAGGVVLTGVVLGPVAALVITAAALVARFGERGAQARYSILRNRSAAARRKAYYVLDTGSSPAAAKEIRLLGTLSWWRERGDRDAAAYLSPLWRARRRIRLAPFTAYSLVVLAATLAVLLMLRDNADRGGLSVLGLSLAVQAILVPLRFGVYFPEADAQTQDGMHAYGSILAIEQAAARQAADRRRLGGRPAGQVPVSAVTFEKVSFSYPGSSRHVLQRLDLEFPAGTSTAIVGLNGAGKTTLVKLLSRLYEPTGGRISVDGIGLDEFDSRSWQRRLAVIYQDYVRYELDAAANIGLGAPRRLGDSEALRRATEWAGAVEVIATLPDGLATVLSSRYSGGVDLSGGQWQRIALARALFAVQAGASVLVLDEPTAQLDVRAEVAFFDRFLELTRGLTTVVISHRFSTVRRADRIVVLDGGRITEQGSHEELVAAGGQYAELFELQARRFTGEEKA